MSTNLKLSLRVAAVAGAAALAAMPLAPALAADGSAAGGAVQVANTETVQVYTDATGAVKTRRVYEQVALTGSGTVELSNPIETDGLRNLDGFGGFDVEDGRQVATLTVDGEQRLRTVSDFDGDLPLEVDVQYFLDGQRVEPGDVVGADGRLEVRYAVTNVTAEPREVTFDDGAGGEVTKTVDVPVPMVGSLTTTAPSTFTDVQSEQANIAGDGKGGTKLSFTMTLFPPLGSDTAEFGYTANVTDGVVPRADISALPVNPLASPTFKTAASSYQGGADTGAKLADGATQIDANLLKLRDGAGELLAGLIQLRDGSSQLEAGLAGEAAPGSRELADGAGELDSGLGLINSGARRLADGTGELYAGTGDLTDGTGRLQAGAGELAAGAETAADGGRRLRDGAGDLSDGLSQLEGGANDLDAGAQRLLDGQTSLQNGLKTLESGVKTLPASVRQQLTTNTSYQALLAGMQNVVNGIGSPTDVTNPATGQPATIFGGLNAIRGGLSGPVLTGVQSALDGIPASQGELTCGSAVLTQLAGGAAAPTACGAAGLPPVTNPVPAVEGAQRGALNNLAAGLTDGVNDLEQLENGLNDIKSAINDQFLPGIDRIKGGMSNPGANANCAVGAATSSPADDCGVQQAVAFFKVSVPQLVDQLTANISTTLVAGISVPGTGCDPAKPTLLCGSGQLVDGAGQLKAGTGKLSAGAGELDAGGALVHEKLGELAAGLTRLSGGAFQLADGTGELDAGAERLRDGAGRLDDGAGQLADGTGKAADGSGRLADGAGRLADGLQEAANGTTRLTDGLEKAADGAPKLVDGAQRLSDEGTSKLVEAGEDTAQNYGELYATLEAGSERAQTENMAYGAPEGAVGLTAYSFVLEGENGEGGRNVARGLTGLAVLGAGAGAFAFRRRLV